MPPRRGSKRNRKVSDRMAIVDEDDRRFAQQARLDALEEGLDGDALAVDDDDDEFDVEDEIDPDASGRKAKKRGASGKKKGRFTRPHAQRSFAVLLEESGIIEDKVAVPHYLSIETPAERVQAPRRFCEVCGNFYKYRCVRCGEPFCSKRCYRTHNEVRCLKFGL